MRTPPSTQVCRLRWGHDGSGRPAACHQRRLDHQQSRSPAGISLLRNGRRSRSCGHMAARCRTSLIGSSGRRRPSPGSCGAMPPAGAAAWSIGRQQRSGTPSGPPAARSGRSWRSTRRCGRMCRNDWPAWSSLQAERRFLGRAWPGTAVGMDGGRTGGGQVPGARSRSPAVCQSTSRTMRQCASAMRPSTRRCSFKVGARCAAS